MPLKSTDMAKNMAKTLDRRLKAESLPDRFGQASKAAVKKEREASEPVVKLASVNYRLPVALVNALRDQAIAKQVGINDLVASALTEWLATQSK